MIFYILPNPVSRYAMLAEFSSFIGMQCWQSFLSFTGMQCWQSFLEWKLPSDCFGSARQLVASVTSVPKSKQ